MSISKRKALHVAALSLAMAALGVSLVQRDARAEAATNRQLAREWALKLKGAAPLAFDSLAVVPLSYRREYLSAIGTVRAKSYWRHQLALYSDAKATSPAERAMLAELGSLTSEQRGAVRLALDSLDRMFDPKATLKERRLRVDVVCQYAAERLNPQQRYRIFARLGPNRDARLDATSAQSAKAAIGSGVFQMLHGAAVRAGLLSAAYECDCHLNSWCNIYPCAECVLSEQPPTGCGCFGIYACNGATGN